jgi:glutaredoxin
MKAVSAILLLLVAGAAQAQMYKWVDEKGVTHFSDIPPQSPTIKAQIRDYDNPAPDIGLPYNVAQAMRNNPVILYTSDDCDACDKGRNLLQTRGVPFSEKTVVSNEDQEAYRQSGGANQVPMLVVGATKLAGYEPTGWHNALSAANYPTQGLLPQQYKNPQAESAAPRPATPAPRTAKAPPAPTKPVDKPATTPAIQF